MEKELEERELKELELMNENENREFYVYVHIRLDNNTVFYVGKGKGNRAYKLFRGKGTHHDNICKSCDCKVVIIKNNLTESQAFRLESKMIKYYVITLGYGINIEGYDNYDHNLPHLTNCTWGGEGTSGRKQSEETRRKRSESMKGKNKGRKQSEETIRKRIEKISGENNGMYGKHHTKEAKEKMSESHKGQNPYANKTPEEMEEIRKKMSESKKGIQLSEEHKQKLSESHKGKMVGEKNPMFGKNAFENKTKEEMEITRKKMSESHKGQNPYANKTPEEMEEIGKKISEAISGENHPMYGKHYSEEHNKKIGEANSKKVICITTGKKFDSIKDASDYYKCNNINACCKGRLKSAGKLNGVRLQWKYLEDYDDNCLEEYKLNISDQRSKKVICITTGKKFDSLKEASNYYNILNQSNISRCCRGELKSAGKLNGVRLQWKYLEDYDDNCLEEYKLNISDQRSKKVICITTGKIFDCIKDAEKHYSCIHISLCCKGKQKYAGKLNGEPLKWKYYYDNESKEY